VRISRILLDGDVVRCAAAEAVAFEAVEELGGQPVHGVSVAQLAFAEHAAVHLVRIAVGGGLSLHTGPESGFVQVVEGAGTLVLPGDVRVLYRAPELFLFAPETLHGWTDVTADTLMAACLVS
jgi:quercetin dioxygenase-like cupin family protein